jgi:Eukaryotic elongation factor 5A hypusine, DNA-binding OB fold
MTNDGNPKDDVKVPESDLGKEIQANFEDGKDLLVTIISAMGEEQVCPVTPVLPPFSPLCRPSALRRPQKALNDSVSFLSLSSACDI